jgi:hypothetical protein
MTTRLCAAALLAAGWMAAACGDPGDSGGDDDAGGDGDSGDGDSGDGDSGGDGGSGLCADRTGGALIAFEIVEEEFTVWSTNDAFIEQAEALEDRGVMLIPMFNHLLDGQDCDPQWSWHVDPEDMLWAEVSIEVCDSRPSLIEEDKTYWLETVDQYCPWSASVVDVAVQ